jgi:hypothetical protein
MVPETAKTTVSAPGLKLALSIDSEKLPGPLALRFPTE